MYDARPDAEPLGDLGNADEVAYRVPRSHIPSVFTGYDKKRLRMIVRRL